MSESNCEHIDRRDRDFIVADYNYGSLRKLVTMAGYSESTDAIRLAAEVERLWKLEDRMRELINELDGKET